MGTIAQSTISVTSETHPVSKTLVRSEPAVANARVVACMHADRCAGCPSIGMPYEEQLGVKRLRVIEAVSGYIPEYASKVDETAPAQPVVEYRTRAKLMVAPGGKLGLYARGGGHQIVDIPHCRVLAPTLAAVAESLRADILADEASGGPLAPWEPPTRGALRAIDLREVRPSLQGSSRVLLTFVVQRRQGHDIDALRARAQQVAKANPQVLGIAANFHEGDSPQVLGQETVHLWGESSAFDRNETSTTLATFGSFVQAHRGQASRIHTLVVNFVLGLTRGKGQAPRVLDLYGGSGAISMALLAKGAHVHLVETFAPAVASAQAAAKAVAETNPSSTGALTAECGDVASVIRRIVQKEDGYDAVVVNPPRRGISALAREWISRIPTERLVYVSCNPETLARDLAHFQDLGFEADTLHPIDMIPLSEEVETVAFLRRVAPSSARVLHEDTDLVIIDKGGHEPTMPQGEYSLSALQRVRLEARLPTATPVHRHDVGTSGVLVLSKAPQDVNRWHKVVHEASSRRIFLVAARGITPAKGSITRDLREGGQVFQARTRYRRLAIAGGHSILRVIPEQDHPHQARRHLAAIGHPILGDERYGHGPTNRFFEEKHGLDRTFLHCVRFEFDDPRTNARRFVDAPLPADLLAVVERLGGQETLRFLDHKHALGKGSPPSSVPPPPNSSHTDGGPVDVDASVPSTRHDHTGSYSFDD